MCGIAGIVGCPVDEALLGRLAAQMQHRGPDGGGFLHDEAARVGLVARRLAIVDIAGGEQPMTTPDGRCTLRLQRRDLQRAGAARRARA